jgi:hypothetical protein
MFSESLLMALMVLLLCGAGLFYMYVRMTFLEKKFLVMESILVDLRVAMDSLMMEHMHHPAAPIAMTPGVNLSPPVPLNSSESEAVPEENFYSSVLEQAHENNEAQEGVSADSVLESFDSPPTDAPDAPDAPTDATPAAKSLDAMTRPELVSLAETKGIRIKRSMNRGEVLSLLRSMDAAQNQGLPTGAENVSGSAGGSQQLGSSLDGSVPLDMEQGEKLDQ